MAQDTWINVTAGLNVSKVPDLGGVPNVENVGGAYNTAAGGTAAAGNFTVSFDSAVVTTLSIWDACVATARRRAIGGGLK